MLRIIRGDVLRSSQRSFSARKTIDVWRQHCLIYQSNEVISFKQDNRVKVENTYPSEYTDKRQRKESTHVLTSRDSHNITLSPSEKELSDPMQVMVKKAHDTFK